MGTTEDPVDGKKVAGTIFGAVFVYIVRLLRLVNVFTLLLVSRDSSYFAVLRLSYTRGKVVVARSRFHEYYVGKFDWLECSNRVVGSASI
jgi:hypothetical protein